MLKKIVETKEAMGDTMRSAAFSYTEARYALLQGRKSSGYIANKASNETFLLLDARENVSSYV